MRLARLFTCLLVATAFSGPISSLFAQDVTSIVHDVSDVADGSIEQARLEAQRQATGAGPAYRSFKRGDTRFFSGKYTPPELPEDKKDRFVYGLAMFSDDGCDVTIKGSRIHQRLGKGQHLPNLGDSFHLLPIVLTPGEPVDITVGYSNIIYVNDPDSPDYPDIDGCTLFLYLIPVGIAVDANRDGTIAFSGEARDVTSQAAPFRFWCNDDDDGDFGAGEENAGSGREDHNDGIIKTTRDLEDFTRMHINICGLQDAIADGLITVGLEWRHTTGSPSIKLYQAAENDGGDQYLKTELAAGNQALGAAATTLSAATAGGSFKFPLSFWKADALSARPVLSTAHPNRYLVFEGSDEGKGQLVLTFWKGTTRLGECGAIWLELLNVKQMYQRGRAISDFAQSPADDVESWTQPQISSELYDIEQPFSKPAEEDKRLIVYVHGINGPGGQDTAYESWQADSETIFKRLWHHGYKGRFATFKWLALTPALPFKFNESEYRGWTCGRGLTHFVNTLSEANGYKKNLYSFSQGAAVCGAALITSELSIDNYVMSQAAVPAGCFDTSAAINSYPAFLAEEMLRPTPHFSNDLGYCSYLATIDVNVLGSVVSFFNTSDYALKSGHYPIVGATNWEANEINYKPNLFDETSYTYTPSLDVGQRCKLERDSVSKNRPVTSIHESMAFVARPRSEAAGANVSVGGSIADRYPVGPGSPSNFGEAQSDHGGQFSRGIQVTWSYYKRLLAVLTEE